MTAATKNRSAVHIRWMIRRDMPEVMEIEGESFEFPWDDDAFIRCLRQRNVIGMVAEMNERVVSFMLYELHKHKLYVVNFAVSPWFRRAGVGRAMVEKIKGKLRTGQRTRIDLETRESNLESQLFWKAQGFRCVSILPDFYEANGETAYLFRYSV